MEYEKFLTWLRTEKGLSERSARDVVSRLRRAMSIIDSDKVTSTSLEKLNVGAEFASLTMSVKSQLRRSIALYTEFSK